MAGDDVHRLFVYGSLLWEPSLKRTLTHRASAIPSTGYVLHGWGRAWNVVSARAFALADDPTGPIHRRLVLGIVSTPGSSCEGLVLDLADADLAALAPREAAYDLTVVAHGANGPVETFVPRTDRVVGTAPVDEPLVVEQAYLDECRAGIAAHALTDAAAELDRSLTGLRIATAAP